jgi:hypothetical protein
MHVRSNVSIFFVICYEEDTAISTHILNNRHQYGHMEDIKYVKDCAEERKSREN